jgi:hypothetical protein
MMNVQYKEASSGEVFLGLVFFFTGMIFLFFHLFIGGLTILTIAMMPPSFATREDSHDYYRWIVALSLVTANSLSLGLIAIPGIAMTRRKAWTRPTFLTLGIISVVLTLLLFSVLLTDAERGVAESVGKYGIIFPVIFLIVGGGACLMVFFSPR